MSKIASRQSFGEALAALGEKNKNVVCFDADLSKSTMSMLFAKKFPERFYEMGIQEANMIGAAAGMAFMGKIPFICSFGAFVTGRFDQIRMSLGYANANVKIIGTHSGVGIGEDGHSQMGLEDLSIMRSIANMVVLQPADDKETKEMIEWAAVYNGPVYLRLTRQGLQSYNMPKFEVGVFPEIKSGEKVAFLGCAGLLEAAYEAAGELSKMGKMNPAVYNASTSKPLNNQFMKNMVNKYSKIVVFEDHNVNGGTGSAICEWVAENAEKYVQVYRYGVRDVFGESGTPEALYQKFGFTKDGIMKMFL